MTKAHALCLDPPCTRCIARLSGLEVWNDQPGGSPLCPRLRRCTPKAVPTLARLTLRPARRAMHQVAAPDTWESSLTGLREGLLTLLRQDPDQLSGAAVLRRGAWCSLLSCMRDPVWLRHRSVLKEGVPVRPWAVRTHPHTTRYTCAAQGVAPMGSAGCSTALPPLPPSTTTTPTTVRHACPPCADRDRTFGSLSSILAGLYGVWRQVHDEDAQQYLALTVADKEVRMLHVPRSAVQALIWFASFGRGRGWWWWWWCVRVCMWGCVCANVRACVCMCV